ncbi:MAG TPA: SIR2 family protein [Pyrinomonadaceae bacterium]
MAITDALSTRRKAAQKHAGKLVYYREAEKALKKLDEMLGKSHSDARDSILKMTHTLLNKSRRVILYLGAGCSIAVDVTVPKGYPDFKSKSWVGLLDGLFDKMSREKRAEFMQSLKKRAGTDSRNDGAMKPSDLLQYFDKLQVAWYLSSQFPHTERDEELANLVEPPVGSTFDSPLHEELTRLPFDDIVTTNYDGHIARFLRREKKSFTEITRSVDLVSSKSEGNHRLFYLHGKARQSRLVFDRFDYAELLAERDGILDYVTYLLMDSHVIYVGFGLDDPTFNLMETRLQTRHGVYRPQSFAFIPAATEIERAAWRNRKLDIIDYGDYNFLPEIMGCVNKILEFIGWADPLRRSLKDADPKKDSTKKYMAEALDCYIRGKFHQSLLECRAALASTLFWERQPLENPPGGMVLPFNEAVRLCAIRIRMALTHYKLLWAPDENDAYRKHQEGLSENEDAARYIIKEQREYLGTAATPSQNRELDALENSLNILRARVLYHSDKFSDARTIYEQVVKSGKLEIPEKKRRNPPPSSNEEGAAPTRVSDELIEERRKTVLRKLRFAEGYFYANCQISRIAYQFLGEDLGEGLNNRAEQVGLLDELVREIEKARKFIEDSEADCKAVPEWDYYRNSIGILHRIAVWTAGRHAVGVCRDVIPTKEERHSGIRDKLSYGIRRLEDDPVGAENIQWEISQRWLALRYRYLCRAYALRWVVGQGIADGNALGDADLVDAYKAIQKALEVAQGPGLERERMVNLLEAARLNILAMFGERLGSGKRGGEATSISPLSFGAGLYYLDAAFREIDEVKKRREVGWLQILSYRIASYFAAVSGQERRAEIARVRENNALFTFLSKSVDEMRDIVAREHKLFAQKQGNPGVLDQRIEFYQKSLGAIREELGAR